MNFTVEKKYCLVRLVYTLCRQIILVGILGLTLQTPFVRAAEFPWHIKTGGLLTHWAAEVNPTNAQPDYPRPQMVRPRWLNLNGLWNYVITSKTVSRPDHYDGNILVPYPVESALSGVKQSLNGQNTLWYQRIFTIPSDWEGQRVLLHFGAVDWATRIFVDGQAAGFHTGGYDPFTFDITSLLTTNPEHMLLVQVTDPTEGDQPRGKQSLRPENIFYTSTSGIWQTVWLEPVPEIDITELKITPDFDSQTLRLQIHLNKAKPDAVVIAKAFAGGRAVAVTNGSINLEFSLSLPDMHAWSPADPFLYDLQVDLTQDGKLIDSVSSYFGMRKISLQKDAQGATRIALNNRILFQLGVLDQGFWPDGIYTAPTDDALASDLRFLKQAGFDLVRKHVKVEPDRWYYWCDKLGLLVWQDMPSGDNNTPQSRVEFEAELKRMIMGLGNHPCIVQWILFNEGWGQYDTERLTSWIKSLDPARLVDNASGWADHQVGDVLDAHTYPAPEAPASEKDRASVIGEFGGLGLMITNHTWSSNAWSYEMWPNTNALQTRYAQLLKKTFEERDHRAVSAAIYTQVSDIEAECNGLLTYDRAVQKLPAPWLADVNSGAFQNRKYLPVLSDALSGNSTWQYTFAVPPPDWIQPDFNPVGWRAKKGSPISVSGQ
jgi:beta-galactosidase/beta-glucuronidase